MIVYEDFIIDVLVDEVGCIKMAQNIPAREAARRHRQGKLFLNGVIESLVKNGINGLAKDEYKTIAYIARGRIMNAIVDMKKGEKVKDVFKLYEVLNGIENILINDEKGMMS